LPDVRALAELELGDVGERGSVSSEDVWPSFVAKVLSFVDVDAIRPLRVVIDAAKRDGRRDAPAGPRDRCRSSTVDPLLLRAGRELPQPRAQPAAPGEPRVHRPNGLPRRAPTSGVAYDGDADRCFFVDDTGEFVPGDFATALMAKAVLAKTPGEKVIYDVRASWAVPETIEQAGGVPLVNRVGHAFIKQRMRAEGRCSGARSRPTTTSGSSRRPTPASCRSS
jgi:phosphomannomutase